jgi:hypothetical protein
MAFRLIKTSSLSGIPAGYALDGRDYAHMSVGVPIGTAVGLSSVKVEVNQITEAVHSNKSNFAWLSSGNPTGRRMLTNSIVCIGRSTDHLKALSAAASVETLTVGGNISAHGGLSATSTATGTQSYFAHNVGIGTAGPASPLHVVYAGGAGTGLIVDSSSTGSRAKLRVQDNDTVAYLIAEDDYISIGGNDSLSTGNLNISEATGNVGIGTTSPISTLEIESGLTTVGAVLTLGTKEPTVVANDVLGRINFYAPLDTGTDSDEIGASIAAIAQDTFSDSVNSTALVFQTGKSEVATTKMVIDEDGKVGVGTSAPDSLLEMSGADESQLKVTGSSGVEAVLRASSSTVTVGSNTNHNLYLRTNNTAQVTVTNAGNVGINKTVPTSKLEVDGDIKTSGNFILNDGGSITENGGTAALTIDGSGHVTKIGQSTSTTQYFLKWDGSKAVWSKDSSVDFNASYFTSDVATGTSPYQCASTTLNTNLNADMWDGAQFSDYINQGMRTSDSPSFIDMNLTGTVGAAHEAYLNLGVTGDAAGTGIRYRNGRIQVKHADSTNPGDAAGWGTVLNHGSPALCWGWFQGQNFQGFAEGCSITRTGVGKYKVVPFRTMSGDQSIVTQNGWENTWAPGGVPNSGSMHPNLGVDDNNRTDYFSLYLWDWSLDWSFDGGGTLGNARLNQSIGRQFNDYLHRSYFVVFDYVIRNYEAGVDR